MNTLQAIANMINARGAELMQRAERGGFDADEVAARLDELTAVMSFVIDMMRAEVADLAEQVKTA